MFQRIIFIVLIVSSLFRNFNRLPVVFSVGACQESENRLAVWVILKMLGKFSLKAHYYVYPAYYIGTD